MSRAVNADDVAARLGGNIRRCRKRIGLSQEGLSRRTQLHRTEIGLLERGERTPRVDTVIRLASALSVPPAELLVGINWKPGDVEVAGGRFEIEGEPEAA